MMNLLDHYPDVLKGVIEFHYINAALAYGLEDCEAIVASLPDEHFPDSASDEILSRMEAMYGLDGTGLSRADRVAQVEVHTMDSRPYTLANVQKHVDLIAGEGNCILAVDNYTMRARLALSRRGRYEVVKAYLEAVVPSNIGLDFSLAYNTYGTYTGKYTHQDMSEYTYQELREKDLGRTFACEITAGSTLTQCYVEYDGTKYRTTGDSFDIDIPAEEEHFVVLSMGSAEGINTIVINGTTVKSGTGTITYTLNAIGAIQAEFGQNQLTVTMEG